MAAKNAFTQEQFENKVECGDFSIAEVLHKSEVYQFYMVDYINAALKTSRLLVAVFN